MSLTAGRSVVLATDFDIIRVAVTNPAVADATVVTPREVLVDRNYFDDVDKQLR